MNNQGRLVSMALSQVGYKAAAGKRNKYAAELDALGRVYNYPKNGFDWCDIFVDWCFIKVFGFPKGVDMLYQPTKGTGAGCAFSAGFYRSNNAFSNVPAVGSQIFFGSAGAENHTGIVVGTDSKYIYTVEGNTGGGNGMVKKKQYIKSNPRIVGYGIPNWPEWNNRKSLAEMASEVIKGLWGAGAERRRKITAAGYDYNAVQSEVNKQITDVNKKIAAEVIAGKWGNGSERVKRLKAAGYDFNAIQAIVNRKLGV